MNTTRRHLFRYFSSLPYAWNMFLFGTPLLGNTRNNEFQIFNSQAGAQRSDALSLAHTRKDILSRPTREVIPALVKLDRFRNGEPSIKIVPPPGTVVVYWTRTGVNILNDIHTALYAGDREALKRLATRVELLIQVRDQPLINRYIEQLSTAECVFDVQYRNKPLSEGLSLLYGNQFGTSTLSFLGGEIRSKDIRIIEYRRSPSTSVSHDYLIAYNPPELSKLEQAAVQRLTQANQGALITATDWPEENKQKEMTEVADVVAKAVADAKQGFVPEIFDNLERQLAAKQLDSAAAVQELMRLRVEIVVRGMRTSSR